METIGILWLLVVGCKIEEVSTYPDFRGCLRITKLAVVVTLLGNSYLGGQHALYQVTR